MNKANGTFYRATGLDLKGDGINIHEFRVHTHEGNVYSNVGALNMAMDEGISEAEFLKKYSPTKREALELLKETCINRVKDLHKDIDNLHNMYRVAVLELAALK